MNQNGSGTATDQEAWLRFLLRFGLGTKLYVLLLAVALPLCLVTAYQAWSSWTTSADVAGEYPIFEMASRREARFKIFMDGVADAVDSGIINANSIAAVREARALTDQLRALTGEATPGLTADLDAVLDALSRRRGLESLLVVREEIYRSSRAIAGSAKAHRARFEGIVQDAVQASRRDTALALLIAILWVSFAIHIGRRLIRHILHVERQAQEASSLNQAIMDAAPIGLMTFGADARIVTANRASHRMHLYEPGELLNQHMNIFIEAGPGPGPTTRPPGSDSRWGRSVASGIAPDANLSEVEMTCLRKDGSQFPASVIDLPLHDMQGHSLGGLRLVTDITERKRAVARVEHLALHDSLTGLPNRRQLHERAEELISKARLQSQRFALALIDLDRFKEVNDTLGHSVGDQLLIMVAERLKDAVRSTDTVVRMGGDEFAILLPDVGHAEQATDIGQKLLDRLARSAIVEGHALQVSASIGLAFFPEHGHDLKTLLVSADASMYDAKGRGRDTVSVYEPAMERHKVKQGELRVELRRAVADNAFVLHYQPIIDAQSGRVRCLEALVRWRHPERGMVPPGEFIPLAEETGLIVAIGSWVIRQACADLARLRKLGQPDLRMAVNISPRQFVSDGLETCVREALDEAGLEGPALELEITESVLMNSVKRTTDILASLRGFGVTMAIDDFGTGYSSLSYLAHLPVQTIKVDRSFVRQIEDGLRGASLTAAIVSMARGLGMGVVAEGIETAKQHAHLVDLGCDLLQGFRFAMPMAYDDLKPWLSRNAALTQESSGATGHLTLVASS
jgi:diguanylate cyclase (GGDEF)-like protein